MEQQKVVISLDNFKPMKATLKVATSAWISNKFVVKPLRFQGLSTDGTLLTIEIRQVWDTLRYSKRNDNKVISTTLHISAQKNGHTKWLPSIVCPLDFKN